ncbi:MAG TPA: hypothetical protein DCY20_07650 [Firmicutes bacterium]|nr:hypothetical protein [Bacillota bacterium]
MKHLYILIGNGSSIGIIQSINENRRAQGLPDLNIDLTNLFKYGDYFNFPMTNDPFLSPEHTPILWQLGARPGMDKAQANTIISQIITCGNVYALAAYEEEIVSRNNFNQFLDIFSSDENNATGTQVTKPSLPTYAQNNSFFIPKFGESEVINKLYFSAYGELSSYLRYLIIYYNSQVTDQDLANIEVGIINYIKKNGNNFSKIIFNSYNYDIFMERLLMVNQIPFTLGTFSQEPNKVLFYKPHGSISFSYKEAYKPGTEYKIPYHELSFQQKIKTDEFNIKYFFTDDYPKHNGLVPPYGEAERYEIAYYQKIRNTLIKAATFSQPDDVYFIIGNAYGNVDRFELDRINTSYNKWINVTYVDPFPNNDYQAVLSSLFYHYTQTPVFPE